jgi:hypothetical protein
MSKRRAFHLDVKSPNLQLGVLDRRITDPSSLLFDLSRQNWRAREDFCVPAPVIHDSVIPPALVPARGKNSCAPTGLGAVRRPSCSLYRPHPPLSSPMRRPIHQADDEHHTKQQTSSWSIVHTPAATATATAGPRDGCQYFPMMTPTRSMAELPKNIPRGLHRRTLSFFVHSFTSFGLSCSPGRA